MLTVLIALSILTTAVTPQTPAAVFEPLQPCDFGRRHPQAPEELDQFAFLIGNWEIETRLRDPSTGEWSEQPGSAYWEGRWILDGRAVADYWYDAPPRLGGEPPGRGVNVRMYRPEIGRWTNMWQHSRLAEVRTLLSEVREDGRMHMWASHPDTSNQRRMTFVVESPDYWYRLEERSSDGGQTWFAVHRIEAHRAPCPLGGS